MPSIRRSTALAEGRGTTFEIRVAGRPVIALTAGDRRVRVGLVMPVGDRVVDISVQPSSATTALEQAALRSHVPMSTVERAARTALVQAADRAGAWTPGEQMCLVRAVGGVAFPLLGAAYDDGAAPLREVPRWAEPILAASTIGEAATVTFGAGATRPVRRAMVDAIRPLPDHQLDLTALGLAHLASDVLEPDQLARVLTAERVVQPAPELPERTVRGARLVLDSWGPRRTERVLVEAAGRADGMALLLETIGYALQLGDHGPASPLPNRLGELHDVHRALMRSGPVAVEPQRAPAPEAPWVPCPRRAPHRALAPPVAIRRVSPNTPITAPLAVRALDGRRAGDLSFVLPHTVGDLERWGRLLSNCLADFGAAAVTGHSILLGVMRSNQLIYAIELTPAGALRQFCARANRRPSERDRRIVVDALAAAGMPADRSA